MLTYGHCIDSMRILYEKNGIPVLSEKHGGPGGNANAEVIFVSSGAWHHKKNQEQTC